MSIFSGFQNVVRTVLRIGGLIVPALRALRPFSDEIDNAFEQIDGAVAAGGEAADDFFDRNMGAIGDIREVGIDLQAVGLKIEETCDEIVKATQVETPDTITIEEGEAILERSNEIRKALADLVTKNEAAIERIAAMK